MTSKTPVSRPSDNKSPPVQRGPGGSGAHQTSGAAGTHGAGGVPAVPFPATAPLATPTISGRKRFVQSRRRCEICGKRYEGDARDIVVGFVADCGHFYHVWCLDTYVRTHTCCPRCHFEAMEERRRPAAPSGGDASASLAYLDRRVTMADVSFAFLNEILQEAAERSQGASPAESLRGSGGGAQGAAARGAGGRRGGGGGGGGGGAGDAGRVRGRKSRPYMVEMMNF